MKKELKIGVIGLGGRGMSLLQAVMLPMTDIQVLAVCDKYEDRRKEAAEHVKEAKGNTPLCTENYKEVIAIKELDAVMITTSWTDHIKIAIAAMEAGKYAAFEVGGAYSIEDCWRLVHTYEETRVPCMMLENCCYGRKELMVLNMVKKGLFGEVVHCAGGYRHDLRDEVSFGKENRHYRLANYTHKNCENYPTHELGPIAKVLNINRGNRMLSLTATASKAAGLHEFIVTQKNDDEKLCNTHFSQGDIVTTVIKCAHGETIVLTLDTTLPRAYCRGFQVQGTRGMYMEENNSVFLDDLHKDLHFTWTDQWNNAEKFAEEYDHPLWKEYIAEGIQSGHDGIDWLVFRAFFESVKNKTQTPIDVYDAAAWMSISTLSEQSIALGSAPVYIPDFTNGKWIDPAPASESKYCLDAICSDPSVPIYPKLDV